MNEFEALDDQRKNYDLVMEEASEVIQAICKINRFGLDDIHPRTGETNRAELNMEVGQLLYCLDILGYWGILDQSAVAQGYKGKGEKLKTWYNRED